MFCHGGYGHTTHQLQPPVMQPYIVEERLCHWNGTANLIVWYVSLSSVLFCSDVKQMFGYFKSAIFDLNSHFSFDKSFSLEPLMEALKHGMLMQRGLFVISVQLKHFLGSYC